jgi:pilus assembly protein CpaB
MAVAAALLAGLFAYVYLGGLARRAPVVVASRDFPAYSTLSDDLLKTIMLPVCAIHPAAIRNPADVEGQVSLVPRAAGEQVLAPSLAGGQNPGDYRAVLGPEERALFMPAASVLGGWVGTTRGDYVDLTAVLEGQALTVAQGLEILEIVFESPASPIGGGRSETPGGVFLRVTPGMAERIALAAEYGEVYCSVFGYSGVPVSTEGAWLNQLYPGGDQSGEAIWP